MRKIKVLIVDDSMVIRRLLSDALTTDPMIEVIGTAANGKIALAKIPQLKPDIISLDMEMPEMDGLETLDELRKLYPKLPVIMFSTLTQRGAEATLEALARGASDYVTKPANVGSVNAAIESVKNELIPKLKMFFPWSKPASSKPITSFVNSGSVAAKHSPNVHGVNKTNRVDIVEAGDGQAAIDLFKSDTFDLILTDWNMPGKSGMDVLTEIRATGSKIPIIMVTTETQKNQVVAAIQAGVTDYLTKPFEADELLAKLDKYVPA